ncbi:MAG: hypothetical protein IPL59_19515 [Candidatus Competibacteraceae bacterium]|nr:hypothetical protein [Candidatus Competibacteraceae bacterium]
MKYMLYERLFSEMQRFRESGYEYCFGSEVPYTGANGNPFRMRFNGGNLAYVAPGSINCCTSILAAFYKESERLSGRDFATCPLTNAFLLMCQIILQLIVQQPQITEKPGHFPFRERQ